MTSTLAKGAHIDEKERTKLAKAYAKRYNKGESIRAIAVDQGRSFGFVHSLLKLQGVELRSRGTAKGTRLGKRGPRSKTEETDGQETQEIVVEAPTYEGDPDDLVEELRDQNVTESEAQ